MSDAEVQILAERMESLAHGFAHLARLVGARLTRQEVCERLGVHRNTLRIYIADKAFPKPCKDGKWLLSEVMEWEARK